jgi:hypothetical protein
MWQLASTQPYPRFVARLIQKDALRQPVLPQGHRIQFEKIVSRPGAGLSNSNLHAGSLGLANCHLF